MEAGNTPPLDNLPAAAVDPNAIAPGYGVYAHHVDRNNHADLGQYVGDVQQVLDRNGAYYLYVRGGVENANELWLPLAAVRAVVGQQVHLNLSNEDLAGEAWRVPPSA